MDALLGKHTYYSNASGFFKRRNQMEIIQENLTQKTMNDLKPGKELRILDTKLRGLQVWIGKTRITYYVRKRGEGKEYTIRIGQHPQVMLAEARKIAQDKISSIVNHGMPDTGARIVPTVEEAVNMHIAKCERKNTVRAYSQAFRNHCLQLAGIPVDMIGKEHLENLRTSLENHKSLFNIVAPLIKCSVNEYCREHDIKSNLAGMKLEKFPIDVRQRYITEDEMPKLLSALDGFMKIKRHRTNAEIVFMLLYTGARKSNVLQMRYDEIQDMTWTIPKEKFKGKRDHSIYLGRREMEIIERRRAESQSGFVFETKGVVRRNINNFFKEILLPAAGLPHDIRVHDIRRTLGTWMISNGTPIAVVSKRLGHSSIATTERIYAHVMPETSREESERAIDSMFNKK